ncbi:MAG: helix-turn-helix domain-containing protein [Proteobacteria bacterium]|nr:helix-turn-helix domain-containing protein [Pseudomonadota bacterium]
MDIHHNARLTPYGREHMVNMVLSGQTPKVVSEAVGVCPRTVRKWVGRFHAEGLGVWLTHLMFDLPILQASTKVRTGAGQWAAEATATFGLVLLILIGLRKAPERLPTAVSVYIVGAYWFTASTSFANPAVTVSRGRRPTRSRESRPATHPRSSPRRWWAPCWPGSRRATSTAETIPHRRPSVPLLCMGRGPRPV